MAAKHNNLVEGSMCSYCFAVFQVLPCCSRTSSLPGRSGKTVPWGSSSQGNLNAASWIKRSEWKWKISHSRPARISCRSRLKVKCNLFHFCNIAITTTTNKINIQANCMIMCLTEWGLCCRSSESTALTSLSLMIFTCRPVLKGKLIYPFTKTAVTLQWCNCMDAGWSE